MIEAATALHTVGVFQDCAWAERGIRALLADRFTADMLTVIAKASSDVDSLIGSILRLEPQHLEIKHLGDAVCAGPLVATLSGRNAALAELGLAATFRRAGFQSHDGYIFETLVARGGVLTAVQSTARAADALARLHAYGAGNAAIGAWSGRL